MSNYAAGTKLSELTLADAPSPGTAGGPTQDSPISGAPARGAPTGVLPADGGGPPPPIASIERNAHADAADRFLAKATAELEAGRIDQPLWVRAMAQSGGDEALAKPAYLRARATALRVAKRDQRTARPTPNVDASRREIDAAGHGGTARRNRLIVVAAAIVLLFVVAAVVSMRWGSAPAQQPVVAKGPPHGGASGPSTAPGNASRVKSVAAPARHEMSSDDFVGKVRELREAGNWNVLVLYAVEWTRKQPGNPQAWKELSTGYVMLRQFDEALEAATRAVQLAPADFELWQTLGQVNVALAQPAKALVAFERAADLNGRDVTSLIQAGMLNAELGHLPQAREAFARALAVSPGDVDALCGSASIAQKEGRSKDADAFMRQVKSVERVCRDSTVAETVAVSPAIGSKKKTMASATRR